MRIEVLEVMVARQKQINAELEAIKRDVQTHEASIERLYEDGQPLADESQSIARELKIELGLTERRPLTEHEKDAGLEAAASVIEN